MTAKWSLYETISTKLDRQFIWGITDDALCDLCLREKTQPIHIREEILGTTGADV
jgi:hypothetical protein